VFFFCKVLSFAWPSIWNWWHICCQNIRCLCDLVCWPFDLRTGPQVTRDVGNIQYDSFGLSEPCLSLARCRHETDWQVDGLTEYSVLCSLIEGRLHNKKKHVMIKHGVLTDKFLCLSAGYRQVQGMPYLCRCCTVAVTS